MLAALMAAMVGPSVAATGDYFDQSSQGWFWYHDPAPKPGKKNVRKAVMIPSVTNDPIAALEAIQKQIERAKDLAVLDPTPGNVEAYLRLNQWQLDQSSTFSDVWRRVVWQHPDLDYSLRRPTENLAVHEYQDQRIADQAQAVREIARTHGLFFFFKGTCPYCHAFAPVLRRFSEQYGINVLPVSLDGGALPEYPHPRVGTTVAEQLGVSVVPSVFLVDPRHRDVIPVGAGVMSMDELANRIYVLTKTKPGQDY